MRESLRVIAEVAGQCDLPYTLLDDETKTVLLEGFLAETGTLSVSLETFDEARVSFRAATGVGDHLILDVLAGMVDGVLSSGSARYEAYLFQELSSFCRALNREPPVLPVKIAVPWVFARRVGDLCAMKKPFAHARLDDVVHSLLVQPPGPAGRYSFRFDLVNAEGGPALLASCNDLQGRVVQSSPPLYPAVAVDSSGPVTVPIFVFAATSPVFDVSWVVDPAV